MEKKKFIQVNESVSIGNGRLTLIAGPCAIENESMCFEVATKLKELCDLNDINYIFKSSFDKANRSSIKSKRGVGIKEGLQILDKIKNKLGIPVVTDVHESYQCELVSKVVDIIQIPAFLARQTDLLMAAAKTGKIVNVKKGQFMAPWDMKNVISKLEESGNPNILLCERGSSFGYNNLIVDMTGILEMMSYGYPVVFDVTHSVQKPSGQGTSTGGNREYIYPLMKAGIAIGVDTIFAEVHPNPEVAISDGPNQLRLCDTEDILKNIKKLFLLSKEL